MHVLDLTPGMAVDDDAYAWTLQALVAFVHQPSWSVQGEPELGFYSRVMQQLQQVSLCKPWRNRLIDSSRRTSPKNRLCVVWASHRSIHVC